MLVLVLSGVAPPRKNFVAPPQGKKETASCVEIMTGSVLQLIVLMAAMTAPLGRGGYLVQKEFSSCYNVAIITCSFMCISVNYSKGKPHNPTHYLTNANIQPI